MSSKYIKTSTVILLVLHLASSKTNKNNARPVHEIVNEQSRTEEKRIPASYGNPLAGNQNIRLHAQNQQAMFNAERVRQHRAQLQRWSQAPQKMDSYMQAYHESQESHQLAVEQQQAVRPENPKPRTRLEKKAKLNPGLEPTGDKTEVREKSRNHRSYGSVFNQQYLVPRKQTVFVSPGPTYDQGVTIKPHGNVGIKNLNEPQENKLHTEAVPSRTQYIYPKPFSQTQAYESAQNIEALNSLLTRTPQDQLLQLNALIENDKETKTKNENELDKPIDLYFYVKTPPTLPKHYEETYAQISHNYASPYFQEVKDHIPITEEVDDVEDPNKIVFMPTMAPEMGPMTTKSNNYYKVEVASQVLSDHRPKALALQPEFYEKDVYSTVKYDQPSYYGQEPKTEDIQESYLQQNSQQGIQHLTPEGVGVSAYGEDDLHYAANYEFGYRVKDQYTGNDFGHSEEKRDGKTNGHYHVLLPDGRMQMVKYQAGPDGYHADITYDHVH